MNEAHVLVRTEVYARRVRTTELLKLGYDDAGVQSGNLVATSKFDYPGNDPGHPINHIPMQFISDRNACLLLGSQESGGIGFRTSIIRTVGGVDLGALTVGGSPTGGIPEQQTDLFGTKLGSARYSGGKSSSISAGTIAIMTDPVAATEGFYVDLIIKNSHWCLVLGERKGDRGVWEPE